jgi:acetyl esterase/lipase
LLKQDIPAQNVVVAGDLAGGNFTITTLMKLRDSGDPAGCGGVPVTGRRHDR